MLLGVEFGQKYYRLHMVGVGKKVHRLEPFRLVSLFGKQRHVPGQRPGITTHIDHPPGGHMGHRRYAFRRTARPGRVQKYNVGTQALPGRGFHPCGGVSTLKHSISQPVAVGIGGSVPGSGGVSLHSNDPPGPGSGTQPDGADAAVGVHHRFPPCQVRQRQGLAVQHLGLGVVDLVKTAGGDGKPQPAQGIQNRTGTVKHLFPVAQHGAGSGRVDVMHHRYHPGRGLAQRPAEIAAARQFRARRDQGDQHLAVLGGTQHHMAQQAGAPVLVVGGPPAGAGQHHLQRAVEYLLLEQAVAAGQHPMGALGIQTANQLSPAHGKAGDGLIAVVPGFGHAAHRRHRGKTAQQGLQPCLFLGQLLGIGHAQQRAAAAMAGKVGAGGVHAFPSRG